MTTKKETRNAAKGLAILFILSVTYLLLVIGDYLIARSMSRITYETNETSSQIIAERIQNEDLPLRKKALSRNLSPMFIPEMIYSESGFRDIAKKHSVAPLGTQPHTDFYFCNEGYGLIEYRSDRFGFRNHDSIWDDHIDVTLIGDSFTQGSCVEIYDTISGVLNKSYKTVNLGTGGNSPIQYASLAKVFVPKIRPEYVAMIFYSNDNNVNKTRNLFYSHYFENRNPYFADDTRLALNKSLVDFYQEITRLMKRRIAESEYLGEKKKRDNNALTQRFFDRGSIVKRVSVYFSLPNIRKVIGANLTDFALFHPLDFESALAIDTLVTICEQLSCKPILVYIPSSSFWDPDPRGAKYETSLKHYAESLKVKFWSAKPDLSKIGEEKAYAPKGPHLSPVGYRTVANGIRRIIEEKD